MNRKMLTISHAIKVLVVNFTVLVILCVVLEFSFRAAHYFVKGPNSAHSEIASDPELGWVLNENLEGDRRYNRCGELVVRKPPVTKYFVKHDEGDKSKSRVLFIGDSFTHAHEVSTGQAYYDHVLSALGPGYLGSVIGVGGYGVSQEFLAFRKVYDQIRPDVVFWQFCTNDLSASRFLLDNASLYNMQRKRPYLDLSTLSYEVKDPGFFLFDVSWLFRWTFLKIVEIDRKNEIGIVDALNRVIALQDTMRQAEIKKGYLVIDKEIANFRRLYGGPMIAFNACGSTDLESQRAFDNNLFHISKKYAIYYLRNFSTTILSEPGTTCLPYDSHWNEKGNRVAAEQLVKAFRRYLSVP